MKNPETRCTLSIVSFGISERYDSGRVIFRPRLFKTIAALKPDVVGDLFET
jgi:hypothetical protein